LLRESRTFPYIQFVDQCPHCGRLNYMLLPRKVRKQWVGYTNCDWCGKIFYVVVYEDGHIDLYKYLPLRFLSRIHPYYIARKF